MVSEVDRVVAQADAAIDSMRWRNHHIGMKSRALKRQHSWKKLGRMLVAAGAIVVGASLFGAIIQPLGFLGTMATLLAICGVVFALCRLAQISRTARRGTAQGGPQTARRSHRNLARGAASCAARALPNRSWTTSASSSTCWPRNCRRSTPTTPAAASIRKLVGEDLPELVGGYRRIPEPLRREAHAGRTPDDQLVDGLKLIEREIGSAARSLSRRASSTNWRRASAISSSNIRVQATIPGATDARRRRAAPAITNAVGTATSQPSSATPIATRQHDP